MRVNFDHSTNETIIRLTELEVRRLVAVVLRETSGVPDPSADASAQIEDALAELFS